MATIDLFSLPKMACIGLLHDVPISTEILLKYVYFYCKISLLHYRFVPNKMHFHLPFMVQEGHVIKLPLQVKWTRGPDMPFGMNNYIQSVAIQDTVYVGGDAGYGSPNNYIVMAYNTRSCKWHQLPPYTAESFAMVVINNQLVLVGGYDSTCHTTNLLGMWDTGSSQWTRPYAAMPTARGYPSTVVYNQWLIVAGGWTGDRTLFSVEVLDVASNQWYSAPSTPTPWSSMKSTTLGDMWYLMGGYGYGGDTDIVCSVSLPDLIYRTLSSSSGSTHYDMWKKISGLGHYHSTPLCMGGALLAVGGRRVKDHEPVSTIQCYVPETKEWVEVGRLPSPLSNCTCTFTLDKKILVFGGSSLLSVFHVGTLK